MKSKALYLMTMVAVVAFCSVSSFAQSDIVRSAAGDKYVISAQAGGINYVEGSVSVLRNGNKSSRVIKGDRLDVGDVLVTGADGRVEVLLNPGSFLRLDHNSSFSFKTTSLENLQVSLQSGSALFEVYATNEFRVVVNVPKVKYTLVETGVYRVDVEANRVRLAVMSGEGYVGNVSNGRVGGGREAVVQNGKLTVNKIGKERKNKDEFEAWSKTRGKELAKATAKLKNNALRPLLMDSFADRRWSMYDSFGLWVYGSAWGGYTFLPFGSGWFSPYGYQYHCGIRYYNLPYNFNVRPVQPNTPPVATTTSGPGRPIPTRPPFQKIEEASYSPVRTGGSSSGGVTSTPVRQRPVNQPAPVSKPVFSPPVSAPMSKPVMRKGN